MTDSITNNKQKRDQIELEYDQDVLECSKLHLQTKLQIYSRKDYYLTDKWSDDNDSNYNKCVTIAQKSRQLKLAKLN